jgi:hypothetical protein
MIIPWEARHSPRHPIIEEMATPQPRPLRHRASATMSERQR